MKTLILNEEEIKEIKEKEKAERADDPVKISYKNIKKVNNIFYINYFMI